MANPALANLCRVYCSTIGAGSPLSVGAAVAPWRDLDAASIANGATVRYGIIDGNLGTEVCTGVYNSSLKQLTRTTIASSNAGNAPLNLSGAAQIQIMPAAEDFIRREILTGNRTYYVRTDGSDSNDGLTNSAGGAFLTIQKAIDVIYATLDLAGFAVTIQVGAGTYTGNVTLYGPMAGQTVRSGIRFTGDLTTPSNVIWQTTTASLNCLDVVDGAMCAIGGFKMITSGGGSARQIHGDRGGRIIVDGLMEYGACSNFQFAIGAFAYLEITANYTISGGGAGHMIIGNGGYAFFISRTVTLTGTPAFSNAFAYVTSCSQIGTIGMTYSGPATGVRYNSVLNSVINTNGGGANYFPGNSAGSTATGGQYA